MKRIFVLSVAFVLLRVFPCGATTTLYSVQGFCEQGGQSVATQGMSSSTKVQRSYPSCTVKVWIHASSPATAASIYSDDSGTALSNSFTANSNGSWQFYVASGRYDVQMSGGGISSPFTVYDIYTPSGSSSGTTSLSYYNVVTYGADSTGVSDSGAGIIAAAAALQAAGGGTLYFPGGSYKVFSVGTSYTFLAQFTGINNVRCISDGAVLVQDTSRDLTNVAVGVFDFVACNGVVVDGFRVIGNQTFGYGLPGGGILFVQLHQGTTNVDMPRNYLYKVYSVFAPVRTTPTDPESYRSKNIHIGVLDVENSYYAVNCQNSGDNLVIDMLRTISVGRSYFVYGVKGHHANVVSKDTWGGDCIIGAPSGYTTEDIHLNYTRTEDSASNPNGTIDVQFSWTGNSPAILRDIEVHVDIAHGTELGTSNAMVFPFVKTNAAGASDTSDRGHYLDGLKISGIIRAIGGYTGMIPFYSSPNCTWSTGDFWRNINVENLKVTGDNTSLLGLGSLVDVATFKNVVMDGSLRLTDPTYLLPPQQGTYQFINSSFANQYDTGGGYASIDTLHLTTSQNIVSGYSGHVITNKGGSGVMTFSLLTVATGLDYTFIQQLGTDLRIAPYGTQAIRGGGASKYLALQSGGATVHIRCISAASGLWEIISSVGTTSFQP